MKTTPENAVKQAIKLILAKQELPHVRLFSNPVGGGQLRSGNWINFGLQVPGSADMIGWRKLTVTPEMVGTDIAQFLAVEVKAPGRKPNNENQINFLALVNSQGGCGMIVDDAEQVKQL